MSNLRQKARKLEKRAKEKGFHGFHHRYYADPLFRQQLLDGGYEPELLDIMHRELIDKPLNAPGNDPKTTPEQWTSRATPSLRSHYGFQQYNYMTAKSFNLFMTDVKPVHITKEEAPWMPEFAETNEVVNTNEQPDETSVSEPNIDLISKPRTKDVKDYSQWISNQIDKLHEVEEQHYDDADLQEHFRRRRHVDSASWTQFSH